MAADKRSVLMKKIGEGYWYNVYEISADRVRKVEKNFLRKCLYSLRCEWKQPFQWLKTVRNFLVTRSHIVRHYDYIQNNVEKALVGNPKFLSGLDYEQNSVTPLGLVLEQSDVVQHQKTIDDYISHILKCWEYGFADVVFNFTINNGFDTNGGVVLHDFNEITRDRAIVAADIASKRWSHAYSVRILSEELRNYVSLEMEERLTIQELDRLWPEQTT